MRDAICGCINVHGRATCAIMLLMQNRTQPALTVASSKGPPCLQLQNSFTRDQPNQMSGSTLLELHWLVGPTKTAGSERERWRQ